MLRQVGRAIVTDGNPCVCVAGLEVVALHFGVGVRPSPSQQQHVGHTVGEVLAVDGAVVGSDLSIVCTFISQGIVLCGGVVALESSRAACRNRQPV